jgi:GNAT superfamily N-acetyltransferase/ribosomal protein L40E
VLSEKASKVFRFEEQNQLHEEIIDTGLAQIYQSHLDVAERIALDAGTEVKKTLLDGKAFQKILDHVRKTNPWLVVVGRIGVHSPAEETGLGSNAENLLRRCPCDVLLSTALAYPEVDVRAEESIKWTPEAEARMLRVPPQVKGIARTGILRLALEKGHSVVTNSVIDEAMERFMPKQARDMTFHLAERMALELAERQPVAICKRCGVAASEPDAVRCGVCGSDELERVEREMLERIARAEGTLSEEVTYDGRKLKWSESAKRALWTLKDAYKRRRAKARIEKTARLRKLPTVTLELAQQVVEEETGVPLADGVTRAAGGAADGVVDSVDEAPEADGAGETPRGAAGGAAADGERHLVARDAKNVPLLSALGWSSEAVERILRVPSGFMRDRTQQRIEALAAERGVGAVSLALVEEGIAIGRQMMEEMLRNEAAARAAAATPAHPGRGPLAGCHRRRGAADERSRPLRRAPAGAQRSRLAVGAAGASRRWTRDLTAYRFCRTDDIGLLVEAHERCRGPEDGAAPPLDRAQFKALVREIDLWCSSCLVALEGREPVGVLLGAKRAAATLVLVVRVHPEHRRRGHGRHLLTSLSQKLAILGPPRLLAEVPAGRPAASALLAACGWREESLLVDWRRGAEELPAARGGAAALRADVLSPISLEEAVSSSLLREGQRCWQRDLPTIGRLGPELLGLGFHSPDRLEACLFAREADGGDGWQLLALSATAGELGRLGLRLLLAELARRGAGRPLEIARVAPAEVDAGLLTDAGFLPGAEHRLFSATASAA